MNRDSEDVQKRILMLLQGLLPVAALTDVEGATEAMGCEAAEQSALEQSDLLTTPALDQPPSFSESARSFPKESVFDFGDVPVVQDRFHALLKYRLQSEIQQNPPLFPWESEVQEYSADVAERSADGSTAGAKAPTWSWLRHLRSLSLPVQVPEAVLATLLQQCQAVAQSSLRDGAKLVRAVEELFPEQDQALNYLAGLVITSPARSGATAIKPPSGENFPGSYEAAVPAQQMVLSLLAAQEIINSLTLTVSASQPTLDRQWETEAGTLSLRLVYQAQAAVSRVQVQVELPCGGRLRLRNGAETVTQRSQPGSLSAELFEPQPNHAYALEIELASGEPLTFTIRLT